MFPPPSEQLEALLDGAAEVIPQEELKARLERSAAEGRPLRVKLGIDPSRPDLHLGHAVVLQKLRRFQDLGHVAVLIIGDFTGRVGDPSGQSETRPFLTEEEIAANAATYLEQAGVVLDMDRAEVRRNAEWLAPLDMAAVLKLTASFTVARMLERDDFRQRYDAGKPISVVEFLYPLMQAYDSVAVQADVEMGGTDQTFNLLVGRDIQARYGQEPQVVFTMPLLEGTDGVRKMSKSYDNAVGLTDRPEEQFGKLMSIPDELIVRYFRLATALPAEEVEAVERGLADGSLHPNEQKRRLAREVVTLYHGEEKARAAEEHFDRLFKRHEAPEDMPEVAVPRLEVFEGDVLDVAALLLRLGLAGSKSEARRLLNQESVRTRWPDAQDERGERITADRLTVLPDRVAGSIWSVGKRRFARVARLL